MDVPFQLSNDRPGIFLAVKLADLGNVFTSVCSSKNVDFVISGLHCMEASRVFHVAADPPFVHDDVILDHLPGRFLPAAGQEDVRRLRDVPLETAHGESRVHFQVFLHTSAVFLSRAAHHSKYFIVYMYMHAYALNIGRKLK